MKEYITSLPQAEINKYNSHNIRKNRKEKHFNSSMIVVAVNKVKNIQTVIEARFYQTAKTSYCCVWIHLPNFWLSGGAKAGGYGYHKQSASLEYALTDAGIGVSGLEGRGDGAMESALIELATKLSYKLKMELTNFMVIKAHG